MLYNALNHMKAKKLGAGKFSDGRGLWLVKKNQRHGKWVLRVYIDGVRKEMGLGRWPDVTIAEAREHASDARKQVRQGVDPIHERRKQKQKAKCLSVEEAIDSCFAARQAELKHDGKAGRWLSPLSMHVIPKIGRDAIEIVDQHTLLPVFEPIWHTKPEAAAKALSRFNLTLQHAAALGLDVDLQATMKVRALLGKQRRTVKHIPALPYKDIPEFYKMLCEKESITCLALRFLILTAARTSEVRFAKHNQISNSVWTIPAPQTKTDRERRIPLLSETKRVIAAANSEKDQELLFPSPRGKELSDAAMSKFMKDNDYEARPHGFRATFRTWAEEVANAEYEVKEAALGHIVDTEIVRAYQRSDRFKKRKKLLQQWTDFLTR